MSLAHDSGGGGGSDFAGTDTTTATVVTNFADEILVAVVSFEVTPPAGFFPPIVSTITDTLGRTWARRSFRAMTTTGTGALANVIVDTWWCYAPTAGSADVTVLLAGPIDAGWVRVFGVRGVDLATPFDVDASLPAEAHNAAKSTVSHIEKTGISTTAANTFMFAVVSIPRNFPTLADTGGGWSQISAPANNGGAVLWSYGLVEKKIFSAAQSGITVQAINDQPSWIFVVDALQAAAGGGGGSATATATASETPTPPALLAQSVVVMIAR